VVTERRRRIRYVIPEPLERRPHRIDSVRRPLQKHGISVLRRPLVDFRLPKLRVTVSPDDVIARANLLDSGTNLVLRDQAAPILRTPLSIPIRRTIRRRELVEVERLKTDARV